MKTRDSLLVNRRFVLKGMGTCITLPLLESLMNVESGFLGNAFAQRSNPLNRAGGAGSPLSASGVPKRLVFIPMGYGVNASNWMPRKFGPVYDLPPLVEPFTPVKGDISFIQNLKSYRSKNPHGGTAHWLAQSRNSGSIDYLAASIMGKDTRLNYLSIGRVGRADGHGGLPTRSDTGKPAGSYSDLRKVYNALFGDGSSSISLLNRLRREESSLDAVIGDAKRLSTRISAADKDRLDEYFTAIRNIEKRLSKAQNHSDQARPTAPFPESKIKGKPSPNLVFDMMVVAMQSDSTRVLTYTLPGMGHRNSHKQKGAFVPGKLSVTQTRDLNFSKAVSRFLLKLKNTKEADGKSLLYHSLIGYGTKLRQGHSFGNAPLIIAGNGGGGIKQGQNLNGKGMSTSTVWLSYLRHVGYNTDSFGQARGGKALSQLGFS